MHVLIDVSGMLGNVFAEQAGIWQGRWVGWLSTHFGWALLGPRWAWRSKGLLGPLRAWALGFSRAWAQAL